MAKSFTPEEMEALRNNPNTWTVTSRRISLTKAAKERIIELLEISIPSAYAQKGWGGVMLADLPWLDCCGVPGRDIVHALAESPQTVSAKAGWIGRRFQGENLSGNRAWPDGANREGKTCLRAGDG